MQASKPMILARKPGNLREHLEKKYTFRIWENSLLIQKKALRKYNSYAIVDDIYLSDCVSKILDSSYQQ